MIDIDPALISLGKAGRGRGWAVDSAVMIAVLVEAAQPARGERR